MPIQQRLPTKLSLDWPLLKGLPKEYQYHFGTASPPLAPTFANNKRMTLNHLPFRICAVSLFKILTLVGLFAPRLVFSVEFTCHEALTTSNRARHANVLKEIESPSSRIDSSRAEPADINSKFRLVAEITTASGETFLKIENTGRSYHPADRKSPDGFKGDLEATFQFLTPNLLQKLGFYRSGEKTFYVPTAETLNARIALMNKGLAPEDEIKIRFYSAHGRVDPVEYGTRFIQNLELPISTDGSELLHDINFHLSSIFIPNPILYLFREQSKFTIAFGSYIRTHHPELLNQPYFPHATITTEQWIKKNELILLSTRVDLFTAADNKFSHALSPDHGLSPAQFLTKTYGFDAVFKPNPQFGMILDDYLKANSEQAQLPELNLNFAADRNQNEANHLYEARRKKITE